MKNIMVVSDLHLDLNNSMFESVEAFKRIKIEKGIGVLVLAGDVSNSMEYSKSYVDYLKVETGLEVLFIPGNHEVKHNHYGDDTIYKEFDEFVLIAMMGWFDTSFNNPGVIGSDQDSVYSKIENRVWDRRNEKLIDLYENKLREYLEMSNGKDVMFVSHFANNRDVLLYTDDDDWNELNNFMGTDRLNKLLTNYSGNVLNLYGHSHIPNNIVRGNVEYRSVAVGYKYQMEWMGVSNMYDILLERSYFLLTS